MNESIGLVAAPSELRPHPRENREVLVRALDPAPGADEELWDRVIDVQAANRDEQHPEEGYRAFARTRQDDYRAHFRLGRGAWYVALTPDTGEVAASCGIVVTGTRGRFQAVDTALAHRRRGIASRLVVEAARHAAGTCGAETLVIVADAGYHALGLYESLGFSRRERVVDLCRAPASSGSGRLAPVGGQG